MTQRIELRKLRDFGQIINDSFTFFKENFKPLFWALLVICSVFILLSTISTIFTYAKMGDMFSMAGNRQLGEDAPSTATTIAYLSGAMISALLLILAQSFIHLVTLCYICVYMQKQNETPSLADVWDFFKFYFWRVLGGGILTFLIVGAGTIFCLIPGIYLFPIMYLVIPIIVIENSSFSYAFSKSFKLIKDNWWLTFGVIFIMGLVIGVAGSIASIPLTVFTVGGKLFSTRSLALPLIVLFSIIRNILLLAYALPAIAICMVYFSLAEQKEGIGLLGRIENFGKTDDDDQNAPKEQY